MTPEKEQFLARIKAEFSAEVDAGYRKGDAEHKDDFFSMGTFGLIAEAKKECVDNYTYLCGIEELLRRAQVPPAPEEPEYPTGD